MFRSEKYDESFLRLFSAFWLEYESSLVYVSLDTERGHCRLSQLFDPSLYTHKHAHTRARVGGSLSITETMQRRDESSML